MGKRLAAIALACAACYACQACQGSGSEPSAGRGSAVRDATVVELDAALAAPDGDARAKPEEPEPPDPSRVIAELSAIPAWQAVIDRAQLLGRRGQHGVVYGRVGAAMMVLGPPPVALDAGVPIDAGLVASPYVWLIDDTEGNGSLAIRLALGDKTSPALPDGVKPGDRIAAAGAWQLDDERRWFWKAESVQPVPPPPPSDLKDPQPAAPGHVISNGELPSGARTVGVARDGDAVYFQIVGPVPLTEGDGWQVADQLGSPAVVVLNLPGERASYGGQEMRAADERWQLKRGQTYWVRLGKLRKRGADKLPLVNARTAPVRVL
ncbi:MAG: hypothetical protein ABIY55_17280 [Kofleriaceae bacterium]